MEQDFGDNSLVSRSPPGCPSLAAPLLPAAPLPSWTGPLVPLGRVLISGTDPALSDASAGRKRLAQGFWPVALLYAYGETAVLTWGDQLTRQS